MMEMNKKNLKRLIKKCEEGPNRNQNWGILKYLSAEIPFEKSETIPCRRERVSGVLGQKMGYDKLDLSILIDIPQPW